MLIRGSFLPLSHYSSKKTMLGLWTCLQSQHQSLAVVQVFWECPCSPSLLAINESAADDLLLSLTHTPHASAELTHLSQHEPRLG